ncbi:hypothetical protein DdX_14106 [Ditylenchus destructor]|uniref:Uncharacterized protein n=1 Tax=Ditylenchus destructor TaxID=166010 RepID=A0AAD4MRM3_9BILA|nr:hypothetical protein DdX_14106 [Ditylenchus destructor]
MHRAVLERIAIGLLDLADEFDSDLVALREQHNQSSEWSSFLNGGKETVAAAFVLRGMVSYLFTYNR